MIIIHKGQPPPVSLPWWVGPVLTCPHCATTFELELTDFPYTSAERHPGGKQRVMATCPVCDAATTKDRT